MATKTSPAPAFPTNQQTALVLRTTNPSTPGRGSTLTLTIAAESPRELVELSLDIGAETPDEDIRLTAKVLVVDDSRDTLSWIDMQLLPRFGVVKLRAP